LILGMRLRHDPEETEAIWRKGANRVRLMIWDKRRFRNLRSHTSSGRAGSGCRIRHEYRHPILDLNRVVEVIFGLSSIVTYPLSAEISESLGDSHRIQSRIAMGNRNLSVLCSGLRCRSKPSQSGPRIS
jgi:hypothetical protein